MNDVKRFDCTSGGAQYCQGCYTMTRDELGDYVLYEDYARLIAERDALQRVIDEARGQEAVAATYETERAALVAKVGDCCGGGDPLCSGGCLVMKAIAKNEAVPAQPSAPIDMMLFCPQCHTQHVDAPDDRTAGWDNPPHRSHLCHACGFVWRPADVATNGVQAIKTRGQNDSAPVAKTEQSEICRWPHCGCLLEQPRCYSPSIAAHIDRSVMESIMSKPAPAVADDVDLWKFMRDVLKRGAAIESQFSQQGYETFIAEIESAARKEDKRLRTMLAASAPKEGTP